MAVIRQAHGYNRGASDKIFALVKRRVHIPNTRKHGQYDQRVSSKGVWCATIHRPDTQSCTTQRAAYKARVECDLSLAVPGMTNYRNYQSHPGSQTNMGTFSEIEMVAKPQVKGNGNEKKRTTGKGIKTELPGNRQLSQTTPTTTRSVTKFGPLCGSSFPPQHNS